MTITTKSHFDLLQHIYQTNPCNQYYDAVLRLNEGEAELFLSIRPDFLHAGGVVHGSVYFKMLDDAATFAVSTLVEDVTVLTASFNVYFMRPVSTGTIRTVGRITHQSRRLFVAEAESFDENGRLLAKGSGSFMRGNVALPQFPSQLKQQE